MANNPVGRCPMGYSDSCCLRRNDPLRLDKIECALAHKNTRNKFLDFLGKGNKEYERFAKAYILLNDHDFNNSIGTEEQILMEVKELIHDFPRELNILQAEIGLHNAQEFIQDTKQAIVDELMSTFSAFVVLQNQ